MTTNNELNKIITLETLGDNSLFAVNIIDLSNFELIYANKAMKEIMADVSAKNCWESIHGQESPCLWCKVSDSLKNRENKSYITYESFNEVANKWYQLQDKIITLENGKNILISFALDISMQKETQSQLINMHVKLSKQTEALRDAQSKLKEQANRDPLTNMYNRRYFNDISKKIIALSIRNKEPLSVIMIDIDKFKNINDTYGHHIGDEVIMLLANKIAELTRQSDVSARFGGEEFAILLPNTHDKNAIQFAQKIRMNIENTSYTNKEISIHFTVSIGVAEFNSEQDSLVGEALDRADQALYDAKENGRNKVSLFRNKSDKNSF